MRKVLCRVDDVPDGGALACEVETSTGGFSVLLTRVDGAVNAFHNECSHAARRLDWAPGKFLIEGRMLICAAHGACFELASGSCIGGPARGAGLKPIVIAIVDGEVVLG